VCYRTPCGKQHFREIATPDWVGHFTNMFHTREYVSFVKWPTQSGVARPRNHRFKDAHTGTKRRFDQSSATSPPFLDNLHFEQIDKYFNHCLGPSRGHVGMDHRLAKGRVRAEVDMEGASEATVRPTLDGIAPNLGAVHPLRSGDEWHTAEVLTYDDALR